MRLGIEKKEHKLQGFPEKSENIFFFREFQNKQVIVCEQWQYKGFFNREAKTNDTFLFIYLQVFFFLKSHYPLTLKK